MTRSIFAVFVFGLMACSNAHAAFVFSNFGPGNTYGGGGRVIDEGNPQGMRFTATGSGTLTQVTLPLGILGGNGVMTVELHASTAGTMGSLLATGSQTVSASTLYTIAMPSTSIVSGNQYWLVLLPGSGSVSIVWNFTSPGITGNTAFSPDGGSTYTYANTGTVAAFSVEVANAPTNPVPEPTSLMMFGLGGLALGARSLRRIKQEKFKTC